MYCAFQSRNCYWMQCCGFAFCLVFASSSFAGAAQPGELAEWQISADDPQLTIRFRFCPAGTIYPGKPTGTSAGNAKMPSVSVREFYLGDTEITIAQFQEVLGTEGLEPLKKQAAKYSAIPKLFETLQKGKSEPALFVPLDSAVDFCNNLQAKFDDSRRQMAQPSLDSRLFRLPSHIEWQYAARAMSSAENEQVNHHFARWIRLSELSAANQQKCQEVWSSLGHSNQFPDSQDAYLELSRTTDSSQLEKVKEIFAEAFEKAFGSKQRSASGLGELQPVGQTLPNAWNLTDLHDGVTEWTMWATKSERTRDLWAKLSSVRKAGKSLDGQDDMFLSGGSFIDSYYGTKALNRFTVWGGPKLDGDEPQPFAAQSDIVFDKAPGFRVLMERVLAEDWLFALRKGVFQKREISTGANEYLATSRPVVEELTNSEHPSRAVLKFYTELAGSRGRTSQGLIESLENVAQSSPDAIRSEGASAASKIAAILNKNAPEKIADGNQNSSDESAYFRTLAAVLKSSPGAKEAVPSR